MPEGRIFVARPDARSRKSLTFDRPQWRTVSWLWGADFTPFAVGGNDYVAFVFDACPRRRMGVGCQSQPGL